MGTVSAIDLTFHYQAEGSGDPLILIPYLTAGHACYAFQLPDYSKQFTCVAVDLRGSGLSDKPPGPYSTEQFGDDIAAFMAALGIDRAHLAGVSLGAVTATWLAIKHPARVASLSIHSGWTKTDPFLRAVVESWRLMARSLDTVADMVIQGIFPWVFAPEAYADEEFIAGLSDFVRSRPPAAARRVPRPERGGPRIRLRGSARPDHRTHAAHLRAPGPGHVHPVRAGVHRRDQGRRAGDVRRLFARRAASESRRIQHRDPRLPHPATTLRRAEPTNDL
jgi:pimeloyl-ACP methyl ester carboxylesterase